MTLIRYQPWDLLSQVQREMNRIFETHFGEAVRDADNSNVVTSHWTPAVDIKEEPERFVLYADLPGVDIEDIDVTMEQGVLTIKGERRWPDGEDRSNYRRVERAHGSFYRRFSLPDTADADRIEARGKNGVLEIVIPKLQKVQPRRISVQG